MKYTLQLSRGRPYVSPGVSTVSTVTKWLAGLNGLLGLWLVVVPFVFGVHSVVTWNAIVVGLLVAATGGYNFHRTRQGAAVNVSVALVVLILGVWVVAAPFVFRLEGGARLNDLLVGGLLVLSAGYNAYVGTTGGRSASGPADSGI